ncbi:MAG: ArgR family transcriptional regulator [Prolixibacteraceae bacterium]|jgi:transcriptional regulator of arginine metabolism|nr:ArgR family transcriptional regulator [Prolixibacteraceae bacterium]
MNIFAVYLNIYTFIMKARLQRQVVIRKIVGGNRVTSQEQLLMLLKREGFEMTQATLSRDIKALKIAKTPDPRGGYVYVLPSGAVNLPDSKISGVNYLADGFLSIDFSGHMAVIRTKPAYASSIASVIDSAGSFEIIGTIAGDDTIFIVLREGIERNDVFAFLVKVLPTLKGRLI